MTRQREFEFTRKDFDVLRELSNAHTGIIVTDDKYDMFYSRLAKRIRKLQLGSFKAYCQLLKREPEQEFSEFINAITTNLTSFFREQHHFEFLAGTLMPQLLREKVNARRIRLWSAGCSSGEEPYSLAMTLLENMPRGLTWDVKILATDIDLNMLSIAAEGVYSQERVKGLSPERLRRWFRKGKDSQAGQVRVDPALQELIRFKPLNLMQEWPMKGPFDIIFCRNVLIYFDKATKLQLVDRYVDLLAPGGHLFIGHSESLHNLANGLELVGNTIYRKVR
jgi:chemotaxis protein methyltransferase CheR